MVRLLDKKDMSQKEESIRENVRKAENWVKENVLSVVALYLTLYIIQYLIIPLVWKGIFEFSNKSVWTLIITTLLICMSCFVDEFYKYKTLFLGFLFYILIVYLYFPSGAYGMAHRMPKMSVEDLEVWRTMFKNNLTVFLSWNFSFVLLKVLKFKNKKS